CAVCSSYTPLPPLLFSFHLHVHPPAPPSFPTRRSSDLNRPEPSGTARRRLDPSTSPASLECQWLAHEPVPPLLASLSRERRNLRSEEHTSELQSLTNIVCRLLF